MKRGKFTDFLKKVRFKSFKKLLKTQKFTENLTGSVLKEWLIEKSKGSTQKLECLLMTVTEQNLNSIGFRCPSGIEDNYILQVLMEAETKKTIAVRLINYVEINEKLKDLLGDSGKALIKM